MANCVTCKSNCERASQHRVKTDCISYPLLSIKAAIVDGVKIKADTWYTVKNGEWTEETE